MISSSQIDFLKVLKKVLSPLFIGVIPFLLLWLTDPTGAQGPLYFEGAKVFSVLMMLVLSILTLLSTFDLEKIKLTSKLLPVLTPLLMGCFCYFVSLSGENGWLIITCLLALMMIRGFIMEVRNSSTSN